MITQPLCINCRHHDKVDNAHLCAHPSCTRLDVVDGDLWCEHCHEMREGECGPEGRLFQPKPSKAVRLAMAVISAGLVIAVARGIWIRFNNPEAPKVPTYFYDSIEQPKTNR